VYMFLHQRIYIYVRTKHSDSIEYCNNVNNSKSIKIKITIYIYLLLFVMIALL
jgi:hypothetical protein